MVRGDELNYRMCGSDSLEPVTVRAPEGERGEAFLFAAAEGGVMVFEHRWGIRLAHREASMLSGHQKIF